MKWGLLTSARCMAPDDGGAGGEAVTQEAPANVENAGQSGPGKSDAPASETAGGGTDQPSGETTTETTEQPAPKPDKVERRIANLTRKMADEARAREAAERRATAAEALLSAGKEGTTQPANDVEARAEQLVAEREFNRRLSVIDAAGKQKIGAEAWNAAKDTLTSLGATRNQAFLQALAEAENPAEVFAHFAEDTDELLDVLSKGAAAMAARIGRLDAKMSQAAAPAPKPLSAAPTPAPKVRGSATPPEPTPYAYDPKMSMADWNKMMNAHLPKSLGGTKARG